MDRIFVGPDLIRALASSSLLPVADSSITPDQVRGDDVLVASVRAALAHVHDPCSIAAGRPTNLIDMGLVLDARMAGTTLHITFCVTFAGCTMAPHFVEAARVELLKIEGVERVEASVDTSHIWTPRPLIALTGEPQAWRKAERSA